MTGGHDPDALAAGLRELGIQPGQDLLVHSSLRRVGPVPGGAATVLEALIAVTGALATIVVPAHTAGNSLSSAAFLAATAGLDAGQRRRYVAQMPGFDPLTTASHGMGAFAEYLRTRPGAVRSSHPQTSFAALGARAADCTRVHPLDCHLGPFSPLGWLYRRPGAGILLLGVGYTACTALHLAEYLLPGPRPRREYHCFVMDHGRRRHVVFGDLDLTDSDFEAVGRRLDSEPFVRRGRVGSAACRLLPVRETADFARGWPPFSRRRAAP